MLKEMEKVALNRGQFFFLYSGMRNRPAFMEDFEEAGDFAQHA